MSLGESRVSMTLLINPASRRVLFAEADKDCVDFLFFILTLPISTMIRLLGTQGMVGSLGNLYASIERLKETYFQPNVSKDILLKPAAALPSCYSVPPLSLEMALESPTPNNFYTCGCSRYAFTDDPRVSCQYCRCKMTKSATYVASSGAGQQDQADDGNGPRITVRRSTRPPPPPQQPESGEGGFVKGMVTYMIMDDLVVKPMSTISTVTLFNRFNIKDMSALEEREVDLGIHEAVKLLKASLVSKAVLTNVFLY